VESIVLMQVLHTLRNFLQNAIHVSGFQHHPVESPIAATACRDLKPLCNRTKIFRLTVLEHGYSLQELDQTAVLQVRADKIPWRLGSGATCTIEVENIRMIKRFPDIHFSEKDGGRRGLRQDFDCDYTTFPCSFVNIREMCESDTMFNRNLVSEAIVQTNETIIRSKTPYLVMVQLGRFVSTSTLRRLSASIPLSINS